MTAADATGSTTPADSSAPVVPANAESSPIAVRIIVLTVPRRRGDLVTALPFFLGRAIKR